MKTAKKFSDPTTGGHQKASPPTASSPFRPVVGVANPFQAEHFKQFCLQLDLMFDPMDRIHLYAFYPSDPGKGEHPLPHDLAILEKALHRRKLFYHDKEGQRCLLKCHTFTTRRGSKMLWSIFKKLTDFNQLGYEIFIQPSIMSGISRISYAVAVSRFAILESDVMPKHDQLIFAQKHPEIVFAIYTGNKSLHSYIRLPRRIHNPDVIFGWRALSTAKGWKPCEHLDFKAVTSRIRTWALANGYVEPDNLITDCGHMVRIAGFRHRNGGYSRLLTRDMLDSIKSPMNQANIESSGQKRSTYSLPEVVPHSLTSLSLPSPGGLSWGVEASSEKCSVKCASRLEPADQWLKQLSSYSHLKSIGITERHTRASYHATLFTVARLSNWSESRMAEEWLKIVNNTNSHTRTKNPPQCAVIQGRRGAQQDRRGHRRLRSASRTCSARWSGVCL